MASKLAERLRADAEIDIVLPVEANALFVRMAEPLGNDLHSHGWHFYKFIEPDVYRLMCSWATTDSEIDRFVGDVLR
jgi:threonine aldolase